MGWSQDNGCGNVTKLLGNRVTVAGDDAGILEDLLLQILQCGGLLELRVGLIEEFRVNSRFDGLLFCGFALQLACRLCVDEPK